MPSNKASDRPAFKSTGHNENRPITLQTTGPVYSVARDIMQQDKPLHESWTPGRCNETAGFLFRHECGEIPLVQCVLCGKPLCEKHASKGADGPLCTTCFKQQRSPHDLWPDNEPFFSGDQYYRGYGHYGPGFWGAAWLSLRGTHRHHMQQAPDDFTEADAESLTNLAEEDFESDMSES